MDLLKEPMLLEIAPMTGNVGAEISGISLKNALNPEVAEAIRQALWAHQVIVFHDQYLSIAEQKQLTENFGPIRRLPYIEPIQDDPDVIAVLKEAEEKNVGVFGGDWHSDFSFLEHPPEGSVLNAVEIPGFGGDTVWSNQIAAYAALPPDLKDIVDGRDAVHVGKPYGVKHAPPEEERSGPSIKMTRGDPNADIERFHPAVLRHPETGGQALFLNPIYTTRLDGMSEAESAPVLEAIYKHCTRPEFCCRLRWSEGAVAIWDNRTTLHYAVNDYDGKRRLLYRTTFGAG